MKGAITRELGVGQSHSLGGLSRGRIGAGRGPLFALIEGIVLRQDVNRFVERVVWCNWIFAVVVEVVLRLKVVEDDSSQAGLSISFYI